MCSWEIPAVVGAWRFGCERDGTRPSSSSSSSVNISREGEREGGVGERLAMEYYHFFYRVERDCGAGVVGRAARTSSLSAGLPAPSMVRVRRYPYRFRRYRYSVGVATAFCRYRIPCFSVSLPCFVVIAIVFVGIPAVFVGIPIIFVGVASVFRRYRYDRVRRYPYHGRRCHVPCLSVSLTVFRRYRYHHVSSVSLPPCFVGIAYGVSSLSLPI